MVAQLDRHALDVLNTEEDVLAHIVARPLLERLEVEQARGPVTMALVPIVGLLHPERHPAQSRLREEDLEVGDAIEDAGQDELCEAHRRGRAEEWQRHPLDELARPNPREKRRIHAGILEGG